MGTPSQEPYSELTGEKKPNPQVLAPENTGLTWGLALVSRCGWGQVIHGSSSVGGHVLPGLRAIFRARLFKLCPSAGESVG